MDVAEKLPDVSITELRMLIGIAPPPGATVTLRIVVNSTVVTSQPVAVEESGPADFFPSVVTLPVPVEASRVPASSGWQSVEFVFTGSEQTVSSIHRIFYSIDEQRSARFRREVAAADTLLPATALAVTTIAALTL